MEAVLTLQPAQDAVRCPALLISAPASGQGKTTVTAALARLHARQGRKVRVFKCGPDFLDPTGTNRQWFARAFGGLVDDRRGGCAPTPA